MHFCDPSESTKYKSKVLTACVTQYLMMTTDEVESSEHLRRG